MTNKKIQLMKMPTIDKPQQPAHGHRRHCAGGAEGQRECSPKLDPATNAADAPTPSLGARVMDDIGQVTPAFCFGT